MKSKLILAMSVLAITACAPRQITVTPTKSSLSDNTALSTMGEKNTSNPQDNCSNYLGKTVSPLSAAQVIKKFSALTPKGEFETTEQYQARWSAALGDAENQSLIIAKKPTDIAGNKSKGIEGLQYNADKQLLEVKGYAFDNQGLDFGTAFIYAQPTGSIKPNMTGGVGDGVILERKVKDAKTYKASNAFGAKANVASMNLETIAIFDWPNKRTRHTSVFGTSYITGNSLVGTISLSAEEAQRLKSLLKLAIVMHPAEPYIVTGTHRPNKATFNHPFEINEDFTILVGKITCGLVLKPSNEVIATFSNP